MKLIDADALVETIAIVARKMARSDAQKALMGRAIYILEHRHEDVVRCKDCKHRTEDTPYTRAGFCGRREAGNFWVAPPDGFCNYGERKEE
jgi:hypothetical protein